MSDYAKDRALLDTCTLEEFKILAEELRNVYTESHWKITLLQKSEKGHLWAVEYIIFNLLPDSILQDSDMMFALLRNACFNRSLDTVQYCIRTLGLRAITETEKKEMRSCLNMMCSDGYIEIIRFLVEELQIDMNESIPDLSQMPIHHACAGGHLDVVQYLHTLGVDLKSKTKDGCTPFHTACACNRLSIIEYLHKVAHANTMVPNALGRTPIYTAVMLGHSNIVQYLIEIVGVHITGHLDDLLACAYLHKRKRISEYLYKYIDRNMRNIVRPSPVSKTPFYGSEY